MMVAILGLGSIGLRHAGNLLALGEQVIGYDPDATRRDKLTAIGGTARESRDEALGAADAVVIASPNQHHLTDLADAIAAGCHVFVEKPLGHGVDGVADLLHKAETHDLVVFAGFNLRYHPAVERAREALAAEAVGRILWARLICSSYLPSWRPHQDYRQGFVADPRTGGILFDDIHEIDLANHLLGSAEVMASVARRSGELEIAAEDCAEVILRHDGGWHSTIHMDFATKVRQRVTEVAGSEGMLRIDIMGRRFSHLAADGSVVRDESVGGHIDDDYVAEMTSFLACARGEEKPRCDGRQALAALEQVLAARKLAGLPQA